MITKRRLHGISVLPIAMVGLTLGAATPAVGAAEFSEAELFWAYTLQSMAGPIRG
jgi:hypothetical protein